MALPLPTWMDGVTFSSLLLHTEDLALLGRVSDAEGIYCNQSPRAHGHDEDEIRQSLAVLLRPGQLLALLDVESTQTPENPSPLKD